MRFQWLLKTLVCLVLAAGEVVMPASAQEAKPTDEGAPAAAVGLSIGNEFIRIRVNPGPQEAGRLAVDTTAGDPSRAADDNQVLIYGSREPWTSYTTVVVDGVPHLFGGPTERRAGKGAPVGSAVRLPQRSGETITCAFRIGPIEVEQELGFARTPTTRVKDAARIMYRVTNRGGEAHAVGLRVMLDTMLGANDGAPLRAQQIAVDTATRIEGDEVPEYWQAFDSLSAPAVISQGTLRAPGLTPPHRLDMVDWGTLADAPWQFPFVQGADFTRQGEQQSDTAVALYWNPEPLAPGESRTYVTLYGVGGVSVSPAQLSLGLTAPAEVDFSHDDMRPFSVTAYVENSGGFASRGTVCALTLDKGLRLADGRGAVKLGLLAPGETKQITWRVLPTGEATGPLKLTAAVTSDNLESNRVVRDIVVNSPPQIALTIIAPEGLSVTPQNRYQPNPFEVRAKAENLGAQAGRNLVMALELPEGLRLVEGASAIQVGGLLAPGGSQEFIWSLGATGLPTGKLGFSVTASAAGAKPVTAEWQVTVPRLTPEFRVFPDDQTVPAFTDGEPTLVPVSVRLAPARNFRGARASITYDAAVLEPLYVSRGEAFVDEGRLLSPWSGGRVEPNAIANIGGERSDAPLLNGPEITLFTVVFMVRGGGEAVIALQSTELFGEDNRPVEHRVLPGRVAVRATEEER